MGIFNFKKDKKQEKKQADEQQNSEKKVEDYVVAKIKSGMNVENAIKAYILLESKKNNISLGYKNNTTYINFRNPEISDFLKDWYGILQLYQHKRLSEKAYQTYIETQLTENKADEINQPQLVPKEKEKSEQETNSDFDDLYSIFGDESNEE